MSVTLVRAGRAETAVFTGDAARELDEGQYERGYGPCLDAAERDETVIIKDMAGERRWADYTALVTDRGWGSSLSVPVPVQQVRAALNVYSRRVDAFDADGQQLAATFAS